MNTKKVIINIFLIIALAAVIIMVVGIFLYDYIPSSSTVKEANTYETSSEVTKIVAEIADTKDSIESSTSDGSSSSSSTTSSIVLKSYSITETDLALYSATGSYNSGKSDPFSDPVTETEESEDGNEESSSTSTSGNTTTSSSSSSSNSTSTNTSDGTLFNSTKNK